ncbi:MAG: stage V sporulation protein AE [Firmicutes bacterium]|nr:stage V sporulation protein AE [Bacillota bacterium]
MKQSANKRKIIVITDGDQSAQKVVEKAAAEIGGRAISLSGGNPTGVSGPAIAAAIKKAPYDPVLVMVDDCGAQNQGKGEQILAYLAQEPGLEILGVIAVASNTAGVDGVPVTASVTSDGLVINEPVDKHGRPTPSGGRRITGDTVDVLNRLQIPIIIGVGDLGKMEDGGELSNGARIATIAVNEILKRSGYQKRLEG